jgi:hypothetical protein
MWVGASYYYYFDTLTEFLERCIFRSMCARMQIQDETIGSPRAAPATTAACVIHDQTSPLIALLSFCAIANLSRRSLCAAIHHLMYHRQAASAMSSSSTHSSSSSASSTSASSAAAAAAATNEESNKDHKHLIDRVMGRARDSSGNLIYHVTWEGSVLSMMIPVFLLMGCFLVIISSFFFL